MRYWGIVVSIWLLWPTLAHAESCQQGVAKAVSVQGTVELRVAAATGATWQAVNLGDSFCQNDVVRVGSNSRAALVLNNDTILRLDQHSTITFTNLSLEQPSSLDLKAGIAHFISRVKQAFKIVTPFVNASIEGTEFVVAVQAGQAEVTVFEGVVRATNDQGELVLNPGQTALALKGTAPVLKLHVRPRDAVQWALYYPAIVDAGQPQAAINQAAQQLATGRVSEAQQGLSTLLDKQPQHTEALALQAIIAVVNNDKAMALQRAQQAVASNPQSAVARLALSYAQQANFDVPGALETMQAAAGLDANNALAQARLAELYLMVGDLKQAQAAAETAVALNPAVAKSHSVLGFANLTQLKIEPAIASFNQAIERDQAEPLARLGLGLAKIRRGELEDGRREIEYAASLDPNNALIRSYLGKAYYEEKRDTVATSQFDMAKALDPNDPTAWFYSAIQKQSVNRPVEALEDLQKSEALNDNRAVYRSKLLLDEDQAARSASQARIYQDLGFDQLAQQEAFGSINEDFANHSAHRFLAESYANRPRHEIGRVSELLQSQLLAPLNINPVAPHLSESELGIQPNAGPGGASFNEYDPLFARNQSRWQVSALLGNNNTAGDEVVYSELYDNTSISVGQYHFQTDGFRDNNDFQHDIVNFFIQTAITPQQSLQFELKASERENGDLRLRFDPENFSEVRRETRDETTFRLGYHNQLSPNSHLLGSFIYRDTLFTREENVQLSPFGPFGPVIGEDVRTEDSNARTAELQYIRKQDTYELIIGAGNYRAALDNENIFQVTSGGIVLAGGPSDNKFDIKTDNAYAYSQWRAFNNVNLTLGLSHDDLDDPVLATQQTNPKLGLQWEVSPKTRLRAAGFRTLKRPLTGNQTLEPTQVAGFNQFFDDPNTTDAKNYGIALEHRFNKQVYTGLELTKRDLDVPLTTGSNVRDEDQTEYAHRAYLYWTPHKFVSLAAEYEFEDFEREITVASDIGEPRELTTHRLPMSVNLHYPNGWSGGLTATYYDQELIQPLSPTTSRRDEDDFWIFDARLGYRLPKRQGLINLEIRNLFEEDFNYRDANFRTGLAQPPTIYHDRSIWLRMALTFD
ncbi:FecR domain-containing protein [Sulfuriflexus mobilis]|uniref:FecR domain-containing protein n=1 Tax=Sulfuriflexus mobilis TaxID=1811807 RepID=UPI000F84C469|nr:FecR domain-containing protein [Sulfuriflexus mobilis]